MPRLYDVLMAPIEAAGLGHWRAALWAEVPALGRGLEVGAGTGSGSESRRAGVIAIDISLGMIERGRDRSRAASPVDLAVADVQALPFRDDAFDWAIASLLFCEVEDPLAGLRELRRVIRSGGSLHLLEHVEPRNRIAAAAARTISAVTGPLFGEHFDRRTQDTVGEAGFTLERADWGLGGALVRMIAR